MENAIIDPTNNEESGYLFMLGLPACYTGKTGEKYFGWRKVFKDHNIISSVELREELCRTIFTGAFGEDTNDDKWASITNKMDQIWNYATTGQSPKGVDG